MGGCNVSEISINCAYTELVDASTLVPHPQNPNTHTDKQIKLLAKLIRTHGWRRPITVSMRSGFVIRGHGSLQAALHLGGGQIPIDRQNYATEAEEKADLIADNQAAELSMFDPKLLMDLIEELEAGGLDMELAGFDEGALERFKIEYGIPDVDFPEFTEDAAKDVKMTCCPKCGHEFPV